MTNDENRFLNSFTKYAFVARDFASLVGSLSLLFDLTSHTQTKLYRKSLKTRGIPPSSVQLNSIKNGNENVVFRVWGGRGCVNLAKMRTF